MLTPRDPDAFRSDVLRRAMRIERRRRRARALMAMPALVAVVLLAVVIEQRNDTSSSEIAAGAGDGVVSVEAVALPDGVAPWAVVVGTDQAMWVLSRAPAPALVRLGRDGGRATFSLPEGAAPDVLVAGTDEGIWATDPPNRRVLRVDGEGDVSTWSTAGEPTAAAAWLGGRLWFAEPSLDRVTSISTDGDLQHHDVPPGRAPSVVAAGPDGSVWYASSTASIIGSVATNGTVNELDLGGAPDDRVTAMTSGPGPALWLLVRGADGMRLSHLDTRGRVVGQRLTTVAEPAAFSVGPNGRLWFTAGDGTVQQQSQSKITIVPVGRPFDASSWALATDDAMWAVDRARATLVRIDAG